MIQILFYTASVHCLFSKIDAVLIMCSLADAFGTVTAQVTWNMCDVVSWIQNCEICYCQLYACNVCRHYQIIL